MTAEEVCIIIWQLLQALKFLHANNVWHRYSTVCVYSTFSCQNSAKII